MTGKVTATALAAALALITGSANAQAPAATPAASAIAAPLAYIDCQTHNKTQEDADQALKATAIGLINKRDVPGLEKTMPDMLAASARAPDKPSQPEKCGNELHIYNSNPLYILMYSSIAQDKTSGITSVVDYPPLPYARIDFIIGWTLFEAQNIDKAIPFYAKGLANDPHDPSLASEYANAMEMVGHSDQALAFVDKFLADNTQMNDHDHALMLRRRGYALGELHRNDEAIDTYNLSLKLDPGNTNALSEIEYNKQQKALHKP